MNQSLLFFGLFTWGLLTGAAGIVLIGMQKRDAPSQTSSCARIAVIALIILDVLGCVTSSASGALFFSGNGSNKQANKSTPALEPTAAEEATLLAEMPTPEPIETPGGGGTVVQPVTIRLLSMAKDTPEYEADRVLAETFTKDTGIQVEVVPGDWPLEKMYTQESDLLASGSDEIDVYQIDMAWIGVLSDDLYDLSDAEEQLGPHYPVMVDAARVNERLVAMPYSANLGLLYYRLDLLGKYGFTDPPKTWDELEKMALAIQEGEREQGNAEFSGFVWNGQVGEGLTMTALEFQASQGGGRIIESDGKISVNNPQAVKALKRAHDWINTISPSGTITYNEVAIYEIWNKGDAAFMRNNVLAYRLSATPESPIYGLYNVAPLPGGESGSVSTISGSYLAIAKNTRYPQPAIALVRYLTSAEAQRYRARTAGMVPTRPDGFGGEANVKFPYFSTVQNVLENSAIARPVAISGKNYPVVSEAYSQTIAHVLDNQGDAEAMLAELEKYLIEATGLTP